VIADRHVCVAAYSHTGIHSLLLFDL